MQRRHFLMQTGALAGWTLWSRGAHAAADADLAKRKLVVIMLRGAVDGLSVVTPYGEREYYQARSSTALAAPGSDEGTLLKLDSRFGLNPALARLKPFWDQGALGFVHASGSPDSTRSHFDAQDYMESGTPGRKSTPDGWMNRLLAGLPGPSAPTRAVSMGATPPRIFAGTASVASLGVGPRALEAKAIDDPKMQAALDKLYGQDAAMARTYKDTTEGRGEMKRSMEAGEARRAQGGGGMGGRSMDPSADNGAPSARSFAADARRLGQLIQADAHTQLAFTSVGGWDTHVNQGGAKGQLANRLASLGEGLEALAQGLGDSLKDTVIVVMSEFGRTVRQNGTGGTDHGRANVMWLLGGPVAGGQVMGDWPGLETSALADGRDLAVTTDFRAVLSPILQRHLGVGDAALAQVFPGYGGGTLKGRVLRA
ncbi:DUF1501 domain-containing protein [Pelomonas sp. V22]|uniref:DUF1501 domain-containing protein n=1 Tax=Pelomonas sp. V22 TaxID=2822139 RepID=UPI0024A80CAF|nr:DUF1501 domain-containing protein [Pelomonas sp. V22]MDI4634307.1 DUF1501 domain-containing protein [Pelomonas sp. V22]